MTTQTPLVPPEIGPDVDAGVIDDARARQRRHQRIAATLIAVAVIAGLLIFGGSGGGSGAGTARSGRGRGSAPSPGVHTASQVGPARPDAPPSIGASGLLSPGVGWAVNGLGFYMTWDGGQHWSDVHVPDVGGDVIAGFMAADSPNSRTLVLANGDSGSGYGTCADPANGFGRPIGHVSISSDSGRTWRTSSFPDCRAPTRISFINAREGFAVSVSGKVARASELLYRTVDGGRSWRRVGGLPKPGPIDFTSTQSGWLLGGNQIYRTTDGGKTWQRTDVCNKPADPTQSLDCGPPHFFGAHGAVQIIRATQDVAVSTFVSTTNDDGLNWTTRNVVVSQSVQGSLAAQMSAPNSQDLFIYFQGGVMARSTDGGRSWQQLPAPKFDGGAYIDFVNAQYGWIQDGGSLYSTTDGGEHWRRMKQIGNKPPTP
jgi:photosystem II stability/assembly factor-like uncharacterized protein